MSNRERRRELIFGILYTFFGTLMLFVGIAGELPQSMLIGFVFLLIGGASWIKLAIHSPSKSKKDRPVKQNAAHMAREAELAEQKRQQELAHEARKQSYLANPVHLKIRQWVNKFNWDWKYRHNNLDQTLYIYQSAPNDLSVIGVSFSHRDRCKIYRKEDGIWYLCPVAQGIQVCVNSESARNKCAGLPINTQEFSVPRNAEQELLPGDCISIIDGSTVCYFRIDQR